MQTSHPNHCTTPPPGVCIRMHVARNFAGWRFLVFDGIYLRSGESLFSW